MNNKIRKYTLPVIMIIVFETVAVTLWLSKDNIFKGRLVIRHSQDGKLYLYDILRIKKETSEPLE